jgi:class 3 adenylate cyclase
MDRLIRDVLASEKFEQTVKNGENGYFDKQEGIFIPKKVVASLVRELTIGPSVIHGSNKLDGYFSLCQIRTKRAIIDGLKNRGIRPYNHVFLRYLSAEYLKMFANSKVNFAALYIDIVGSTLMSMRLSPEKLSILVGAFTQEMAAIVPIHQGYVLKYAGDSVIAFFPETESFSKMCDNALDCALSMRELLRVGINSVLTSAGFEPLNIRIGIEAGVNQIVQIGGDIDIVGYTMNIAAKVTSMARPNGICMGQVAYSALSGESKKAFIALNLDPSFWKYRDSDGKQYQVYEFVGGATTSQKSMDKDNEITKVETRIS